MDGFPVLIRLNLVSKPVITWTVSCHRGPGAIEEEPSNLLIVPRECIERVVRIVDLLDRPDRTPKLITVYGETQTVLPCAWEEMTLDLEVAKLLRDDFEFYLSNREWFRKAQLPYRRGYLLHGPPGNGKTTAISCMMSSHGLTAYTIRLFDRETDDSTLNELFTRALKNSPAIVLLEDVDRAFPRSGESKCGISIQHLLNTLDGIGTGEGVVVVAAANEPVLLDPAILRRPGRFDRVVHFPAPNHQMRTAYYAQGSRFALGVLGDTRPGVRWLLLRATTGDLHHRRSTRFYGTARCILRPPPRRHRYIARDHSGRITQ